MALSKQKVSACYLVTGFPNYLAARMFVRIAQAQPRSQIFLIVQPKFIDQARRYIDHVRSASVKLIAGDVADMHLGLSGDEYRLLCRHVTDIFHLAGVSYLGVPEIEMHRVNVEGTANVLELAKSCTRLQRLNYFSTSYVSGDRVGVIAEDELDLGQRFRNAFERTKYLAEKKVEYAKATLPVTIFRPSTLIGDSQTGQIDRFQGPYYLGILLVTSPLGTPLPLPEHGVAPLHVVPVDFVVEAAWSIARDKRSVGKTFHLVDPSPMSARRVYQLVANQVDKHLPKFSFSVRAAELLLSIPFFERLLRPQRAALDYTHHWAIYNCINTLELLEGTGIRCPPLVSYLDKLVDYVQEYYRQRRALASDASN